MRTAAIAGIGATEFSKNSGRSELQLAAEATAAALADAGLRPPEVDGLVTFTRDSSAEIALARSATAAVRRAAACTRLCWPSRPGRLRWWFATGR